MGKLLLADFKKSNFLLLIIVAAVVLLFVFIPEFIGLSKSATGVASNIGLDYAKSRLKNIAESLNNVSSASRVNIQSKTSFDQSLSEYPPLDRVKYLMEQGYVDHLVDLKQVKQANNQNESPTISEDFIPSGKISWDNLQSTNTARILKNVVKSSNILLTKLDTGYEESRLALMNFSAGVNKIATTSERIITASQAVEYLDGLDRAVTKAMLNERVPRAIFYDWSQISLTPALGVKRSQRYKQSLVPPFDPKISISYIAVSKRDIFNQRPYSNDKTTLYVNFRVYGEEVKSVAYKLPYQNPKNAKLMPVYDRKGVFDVVIPRLGEGKFTLIAYDKTGKKAEKSYNFKIPKASSAWVHSPKDNMFYLKLPYGKVAPGVYDAIFQTRKEESDSFTTAGFQLASGSSNNFTRF